MKKRNIVIALVILVPVLCAALFFLTRSKPVAAGEELLKNGDFSVLDANGMPEGWYTDAYVTTTGYSDYSAKDGVASIVNNAANDARFAQSVAVSPNATYRLTARVKALCEGGRGANVSVEGVYVFSESAFDTKGEFVELTLYGVTGASQRSVTVYARLGGYSGEATGEAAFDSVSLVRVDAVPEGESAYPFYASQSAPVQEDENVRAAWPWLLAVALVYAACAVLLARYADGICADNKPLEKSNRTPVYMLCALLTLAALARFVIAGAIPGYDVDIGCFTGWASMMKSGGPANFYLGAGHTDYPPGYMLILWALTLFGDANELAVKLPPILCDIGIAILLYSLACSCMKKTAAVALSALFAFNPMAFAASAAWGQADSVLALCILLTVVFAMRGKWAFALPAFMAGVLIKPQALMFGPLGLLAAVMELVWHYDKKTLRDMLIGVGVSVALALAVVLPFSVNMGGIGWLFELYQNTMGQYGYATVNGCNLYFLFGKNWTPSDVDAARLLRLFALALFALPLAHTLRACQKATQAQSILERIKRTPSLAGITLCIIVQVVLLPFSVSYAAYGAVMLALCVLLFFSFYVQGGSVRHLPLLGGLMLLALFTLGGMMHERYLFAAIPLLLMAYALERDRRILWLTIFLSLTVFLNVSVVLDRNIRIGGAEGHLSAPVAGIISDTSALEYILSALNCAACAYGLYLAAALCDKDAKPLAPHVRAKDKNEAHFIDDSRAEKSLLHPRAYARIGRRDVALMLGVTALYAVLAFVNLGATAAPQTAWMPKRADAVVLDIGQTKRFTALYYGGIHWAETTFTLETSEDGESYGEAYSARLTDGDCFQWKYVTYTTQSDGVTTYLSGDREMSGRYVRITSQDIGLVLHEVQLRDADTGEILPVSLVAGQGENLIDEQDSMTDEPSWYNSMYFDEIYHARTAYEHLHGLYTYETSHPPLGKVLMSWSIALFGMTPFGWRFAGALCGVAMLPAMYLMGRLLTKRRLTAVLSMLLMALDSMHFTQTRIATIDSFVVVFILYATYFMFRYALMDYYGTPLWKTLVPLALSGLFFGLSVASKWTGCYAGVGLAVIFFWTVYRRLLEGRKAREMLARTQKPHKPDCAERCAREDVLLIAARDANKRILITLAFCLLFFVAIPMLIYYLSYIPYFRASGGVTPERVIQAAKGMLEYHSEPGRGMDHPFYSPWYEWLVCAKPMWYFMGVREPAGMASTIVAMGNLAVWWGGLLALGIVAIVFVWRHLRTGVPRLHTEDNDMRPALLLIAFAAQFLPWLLVPRGTYIYHYFTSLPFIMLCACVCFDALCDKSQKVGKWLTGAYIALCAAVFVAYFPYESGVLVNTAWLDAVKLFQGWIWY